MKHTRTLAIICFTSGILLFAYHHGLIVIRWPGKQRTPTTAYHHATKKSITLQYWHHGSWHTEKNQLIMVDDTAQALAYLISSWLTLLDEEIVRTSAPQISTKKVELQTALISPTGHELFLSFDRTPFSPQQSIYEKWMWIEGLLKTIKAYDATISHVHLLVRHKPLQDIHLDFSNPWPITGFIRQ